MKTVPLHGSKARGRVALVDDEDYNLVMQHRWHVSERSATDRRRKTGPYAYTHLVLEGRRTSIPMHKLITSYALTDHIDHDGLNNQRHNLRPASRSQNLQNQIGHKRRSSKYKNVSPPGNQTGGRGRRWSAHIKIDGRQQHLGYFDTEEEAARAYDRAARESFGEFAHLNFPDVPAGRSASVIVLGGQSRNPQSDIPDPFGYNSRPQLGGSSRFKGVSWNGRSGKWQARIQVDGKVRSLGFYVEEADAATAYDVAARAAWGDYAYLNLPGGTSDQGTPEIKEQVN